MKIAQRLAIAYIRTKFKLLAAISKKKAATQAFDLFCTPPSRQLGELPAVFAKAEDLHFSFQQFTIHGYRWNKGGSRKALILHGFESAVINFEKYVLPLIEKGYEVLAFDAPAHGRSTGKRINALVYRDFVKHINQEYGPVQSYVSHSFGGLALSLALSEIPHDASYRAVLIAPATETATVLQRFFDMTGIRDKAVHREMERIIVQIGGHPVSWFSIRRAMPGIRARVLWIHDEDDNVTPLADALKVKAKNHPHVEFIITRGLGHRRIYRDPEIIRHATTFM